MRWGIRGFNTTFEFQINWFANGRAVNDEVVRVSSWDIQIWLESSTKAEKSKQEINTNSSGGISTRAVITVVAGAASVFGVFWCISKMLVYHHEMQGTCVQKQCGCQTDYER